MGGWQKIRETHKKMWKRSTILENANKKAFIWLQILLHGDFLWDQKKVHNILHVGLKGQLIQKLYLHQTVLKSTSYLGSFSLCFLKCSWWCQCMKTHCHRLTLEQSTSTCTITFLVDQIPGFKRGKRPGRSSNKSWGLQFWGLAGGLRITFCL